VNVFLPMRNLNPEMNNMVDLACSNFVYGAVIGFGVGFALPRMQIIRSIMSSVKCKSPKMVLVVRNDLKMGKGKIASQCAHAAIQCYKTGSKTQENIVNMWMLCGQPKVVLKIDSEEELKTLQEKSRSLGLINCVICDAGRTQLTPGTSTVLGIGPGSTEEVDLVTSHLKLL